MQIQNIRKIIENTNGRIFSIKFVKKNGEVRDMVCRTGVSAHTKGGESTTAHKQNLVTVFDLKIKQYRCINLETVISAKIDGVEMNFRKDMKEKSE